MSIELSKPKMNMKLSRPTISIQFSRPTANVELSRPTTNIQLSRHDNVFTKVSNYPRQPLKINRFTNSKKLHKVKKINTRIQIYDSVLDICFFCKIYETIYRIFLYLTNILPIINSKL
jgi:hypothetical protein